MKIQASARLLTAAADEKQAKRFIKHYTGVMPGKKSPGSDSEDNISFEIDPKKVPAMKTRLDKHFKPITIGLRYPGTFYGYYVDDTRTRTLIVRAWIDGMGAHKGSVSLNDTNHREDYFQRRDRLRREKGMQ